MQSYKCTITAEIVFFSEFTKVLPADKESSSVESTNGGRWSFSEQLLGTRRTWELAGMTLKLCCWIRRQYIGYVKTYKGKINYKFSEFNDQGHTLRVRDGRSFDKERGLVRREVGTHTHFNFGNFSCQWEGHQYPLFKGKVREYFM